MDHLEIEPRLHRVREPLIGAKEYNESFTGREFEQLVDRGEVDLPQFGEGGAKDEAKPAAGGEARGYASIVERAYRFRRADDRDEGERVVLLATEDDAS